MRTDFTNLGTTELEHGIGPGRTHESINAVCTDNTCKFMKEICVTMETFYWSSCEAYFISYYSRNIGA